MNQSLYFKIINLLRENEEMTPKQIFIQIRDYSYENVMNNLVRLLKNEIVTKRREGVNAFYSIKK